MKLNFEFNVLNEFGFFKTFKGQSNLKVVAAHFRLSFDEVVKLVCQI